MSTRHQNRWSLPAQASITHAHPGVTMRSRSDNNPDIQSSSFVHNHGSWSSPLHDHTRIPSNFTKPTD
ncbi:hypothetical protein DFH28DRAFT_953180, partial [Melampsora americana]